MSCSSQRWTVSNHCKRHRRSALFNCASPLARWPIMRGLDRILMTADPPPSHFSCSPKQRKFYWTTIKCRVGIVGGFGGWPPPQFMSTYAHFWVKIGFKFQSLGKISNNSTADPSSFRSIPTLIKWRIKLINWLYQVTITSALEVFKCYALYKSTFYLLTYLISRLTPRLLSIALCLEWINGIYNTPDTRCLECYRAHASVDTTTPKIDRKHVHYRNMLEIRTRYIPRK